jgi:AraC-like DNA-binding protein
MLSLRIHHAGVYRHAQCYVQRAEHVFLGLTVTGCIRWQTPGVACDRRTGPFLSLLLPGDTVAFEYGADRENWVVQFDCPGILPDLRHPQRVLVQHRTARIPLSRVVPVGRPLVDGLAARMRSVRECLSAPTPAMQLRAELTVLELIRHMLESQNQTPARTPAQILRSRIDEDQTLSRSLESLSRESGYSPDYLRKLFVREFQVSPQQYRTQRRLAAVMDLVANSRLSLKQIAEATGFRHQSHLSAAFRAAYGLTPRQAIRQFRQGA